MIILCSSKSHLSLQVFKLLGTVEKMLKQCFYRVTEIYGYGAFSKELEHQKVPVRHRKMRCVHYSLRN